MDAKDHIGIPIDLASIRMRGDEAKETVKVDHGKEGSGDLFSGERAGGRQDASVHTAPTVEQVAHCYPPAVPWIGWVRLGGTEGPGTIGGESVEGREEAGQTPLGQRRVRRVEIYPG
jgi:hypothetical protein